MTSSRVGASIVAYANDAKTSLLGVSEELLATHGAVSEPVARAMAEGIRSRVRADLGVGITGIAGPGGGTPEKPVGTVAVALASSTGTTSRTFKFFDHAVTDGVEGFFTITGGKATTLRAMAEATADLVCAKLGVDAPCRTHEVVLAPHTAYYTGRAA